MITEKNPLLTNKEVMLLLRLHGLPANKKYFKKLLSAGMLEPIYPPACTRARYLKSQVLNIINPNA